MSGFFGFIISSVYYLKAFSPVISKPVINR